MGRVKDLTGIKFGKLMVIERNGLNNQNRAMWLCQCECGNEKTISSHDLQHGTISCGCVGKEQRLKNLEKGRGWNKGITKYKNCEKPKRQCKRSKNVGFKRLKSIYYKMINRCYNIKNDRYKDYGARGITICEEWKESVDNFITWSLNNGYSDNLTIDRINNDLGYSPQNCRWATKKEQANNTRNNRKVTYKNMTKNITQWGEYLRIKPHTIGTRLDRGWSIEESLFGRRKIM